MLFIFKKDGQYVQNPVLTFVAVIYYPLTIDHSGTQKVLGASTSSATEEIELRYRRQDKVIQRNSLLNMSPPRFSAHFEFVAALRGTDA